MRVTTSRTFALIAASLLLVACASGYETFYESNPKLSESTLENSTVDKNSKPQKTVVIASSGNFEADLAALYTDQHLIIIGRSFFNGANEGAAGAIKQAQKVGATHVLMSSRYAYTVTGTYTQTVPQVTTSYTSGTVYSGGGFGSYSGTTTSIGSQTQTSSYSVARFDQMALFLAPIKPEGFGAMTRDLTSEERQRIGSNKGMFVAAVAKGSPAFDADILPGDIIVLINDKPPMSGGNTINSSVGIATLTIWRQNQKVTKQVNIPRGRWRE